VFCSLVGHMDMHDIMTGCGDGNVASFLSVSTPLPLPLSLFAVVIIEPRATVVFVAVQI
jgi:hypothetical protein